MSIKSKSDLRAAAKRAGSHFFDRKTMRFFNSKLHNVYAVDSGAVFVTSEKYPGSPRHCKVRLWNEADGDSETLHDNITSLREAQSVARREAKKRR